MTNKITTKNGSEITIPKEEPKDKLRGLHTESNPEGGSFDTVRVKTSYEIELVKNNCHLSKAERAMLKQFSDDFKWAVDNEFSEHTREDRTAKSAILIIDRLVLG